METDLQDRRKVYARLQSLGIDVPTHVVVDWQNPDTCVEEFDEYIIANGVQINKPLVEKPVDAEDHNIHIYYPASAGGGSKHLFRKKKDRSSEFYPNGNDLRRDGSYIYEEFLITQGTDVKVYTVGPEYAHAEARKSPVVDGKVNRDAAGLEVRYPVILSPQEKEMAAKIVNSFNQHVCGFDILRIPGGKSYCCDVNGFSFVKNSPKYYKDASQILMELMLQRLRPELQLKLSTSIPTLVRNKIIPKQRGLLGQTLTSTPSSAETSSHGVRERSTEELRCVIAIIRHADRTPKQKIKIKVSDPKFLAFFHQFSKSPQSDLKVKSKTALMRFLDITREFISESCVQTKMTQIELYRKLRQIRDVLERWEISGINRKLQMKPTKWEEDPPPSPPASLPCEPEKSGEPTEGTVPPPPQETPKEEKKKGKLATEVQLIIKWGGDLTLLGRQQAEQAGVKFRHEMYPDNQGGGVIRLHSTYRHDLKIKSSDEGRCMKTAAAFAKGLLELEGPLTPILASLVTVEENDKQMLDRAGNDEIRADMVHCKAHLNLLQEEREQDLTEEDIQRIAPTGPESVREALRTLKNPRSVLREIHSLMGQLCDLLTGLKNLHEVDLDRVEASAAESSAVAQVAAGHQTNYHIPGTPTFSSASQPTVISQEDDFPLSPAYSAPPTTTHESSVIEIGPYVSPRDPSPSPSPSSIHPPLPPSPSQAPSSPLSLLASPSVPKLYLNETFELMLDRWRKLHSDFFSTKTGLYDLSKVPDVYDMVRYDCLHNSNLNLTPLPSLFKLSSIFENAVVPQEYGIDMNDKRVIGSKMCHALLEKVKLDLSVAHSNRPSDLPFSLDHSHAEDLDINSLSRLVRSRLYFTSESHLHTFLNVFRYPLHSQPCIFPPASLSLLDSLPELSYLTQIVIRLFQVREDPTKYRCELSLSAGAVNRVVNSEFYNRIYNTHSPILPPSSTTSSSSSSSTSSSSFSTTLSSSISSSSSSSSFSSSSSSSSSSSTPILITPTPSEKDLLQLGMKVEALPLPLPVGEANPIQKPLLPLEDTEIDKAVKKDEEEEEREEGFGGDFTHSVKIQMGLKDDGTPFTLTDNPKAPPPPSPPPSPLSPPSHLNPSTFEVIRQYEEPSPLFSPPLSMQPLSSSSSSSSSSSPSSSSSSSSSSCHLDQSSELISANAGVEIVPFICLNKSLTFDEMMQSIEDALMAANSIPSQKALNDL